MYVLNIPNIPDFLAQVLLTPYALYCALLVCQDFCKVHQLIRTAIFFYYGTNCRCSLANSITSLIIKTLKLIYLQYCLFENRNNIANFWQCVIVIAYRALFNGFIYIQNRTRKIHIYYFSLLIILRTYIKLIDIVENFSSSALTFSMHFYYGQRKMF